MTKPEIYLKTAVVKMRAEQYEIAKAWVKKVLAKREQGAPT